MTREFFFPARLFLCAIVAGAFCVSPTWAQQTSSAADYLPATTAIYLHIENPAELIDTIETHTVVEHVLQMEPVEKLLASPEVAMALVGRSFLEAQLGESILDALKENTKHGLWIAVDAKTNGVILTFQAKEEDRLKKVAGTILNLVKTTAEGQGDKAPFKRVDYRDAVAAKFDDFAVARYKNWFAITNKGDLMKSFVDNLIDDKDATLSNEKWFKDAMAKRSDSDVWAAVDMETIRKLSDDKEPFLGRTDNPGVELLFGGVLDALKHSPVAFAELNIGKQIDLSVSAPFDAKWATEAREFFFGKELSGLAPKALSPNNMIANLTSYRDVGLWWLSKEELYAENLIAELSQADSQLSTIFSGMNFGEDVLGAMEPGVQIVVTENTYDDDYVPDVKVPAFALVGKLKDPKQMQRRLKIAFQSVIGFANINLGMNGQPQLDLETEKIGDTKLLAASYFYEKGTEEGLLLFNFSPTVAFHDSNLILSSNRELAVELAKMVADQDESSFEKANTKLELNGKMSHRILAANSESLIAQNMLEEGNDRETAAEQVGILLEAVKLVKEFEGNYKVSKEKMNFDFSLRFEVD